MTLARLTGDAPLRGELNAFVSASTLEGLSARLEARYRPIDPLTLLGWAEWTDKRGSAAGLGARWSF